MTVMAAQAVRSIGGCGAISPDNVDVCIKDHGHAGQHGWESADTAEDDGPMLIGLAKTRDLLEEVCKRLDHQEACEVAALAFRLPEEVLEHRRVRPWWWRNR